jgi:hypothetical protein
VNLWRRESDSVTTSLAAPVACVIKETDSLKRNSQSRLNLSRRSYRRAEASEGGVDPENPTLCLANTRFTFIFNSFARHSPNLSFAKTLFICFFNNLAWLPHNQNF